MKQYRLSISTLVLAILCGGVTPEVSFANPSLKDVSRSDFAVGRSIEVSGKSAIYSFELPEDVYRTVTRANLGDIRVFNGTGTVVPHELTHVTSDLTETVTKKTLPFFPIEMGSAPQGGSDQVEISQDSSGKVVRVYFAGEKGRAHERSISYLLDLRRFKELLRSFVVPVEDLVPNKIVDVTIEGSDDLKSWRPYTSSGVLAKLNYVGDEVVQNEISLHGGRVQFLKVTVPSDSKLSLHGVTGTFINTNRSTVEESTVTVPGQVEHQPLTSFRFDAGGYFPVQSVRLRFSQTNTFVTMMINSRFNENTPWTVRTGGSAYRLSTNGDELISPPQRLSLSVSDRFWKSDFPASDVRFGAIPPELELGWVPHQLFFVAQGEPPFELAYGSAKVKEADFGNPSFLSVARGNQVETGVATLQPPYVIGGDARRVVPPEPPKSPVGKWILWGVLIAFIAVIGVMAVQLGKDLKKG